MGIQCSKSLDKAHGSVNCMSSGYGDSWGLLEIVEIGLLVVKSPARGGSRVPESDPLFDYSAQATREISPQETEINFSSRSLHDNITLTISTTETTTNNLVDDPLFDGPFFNEPVTTTVPPEDEVVLPEPCFIGNSRLRADHTFLVICIHKGALTKFPGDFKSTKWITGRRALTQNNGNLKPIKIWHSNCSSRLSR